jgi:hypothetical protein
VPIDKGAIVAGTQNDAILMIELSKWGAMTGVPEAGRAIFAEDFDPDDPGGNRVHVSAVLNFYETVATLVKTVFSIAIWSTTGCGRREPGSASVPRRSALEREAFRSCTRTSRLSRPAASDPGTQWTRKHRPRLDLSGQE